MKEGEEGTGKMVLKMVGKIFWGVGRLENTVFYYNQFCFSSQFSLNQSVFQSNSFNKKGLKKSSPLY